MGIHSRNRPRGRTIAKGALALGATLTGIGLTASAFDSAGVAQAASGWPDSQNSSALAGSAVGSESSGLGSPVSVADLLDGASSPLSPVLGAKPPSPAPAPAGSTPNGRSRSATTPSANAPSTPAKHAASAPVTAPAVPVTKAGTSTPAQGASTAVPAGQPQPQSRAAQPPTTQSGNTGTPASTGKPKTGTTSGSTSGTSTGASSGTSTGAKSSLPKSNDLPVISDLSALAGLLGGTGLPLVKTLAELL